MFFSSLPESKCNFVCLSAALYGNGLTSLALMRVQCVLSAPHFSVGVYLHFLFAYCTAWLLPWEKNLFVGSDVMAMSLAIASDMLYLCARLLLARLGSPSLFWCASATFSTTSVLPQGDMLGNTTNTLCLIPVCLVFKRRWFVGHYLKLMEKSDLGNLMACVLQYLQNNSSQFNLIPMHFKLHLSI